MTLPAFGFSAGDFVAVSRLIITVVQALRGISDDVIELQELQHELDHLKTLFEQVGRGICTGNAVSVQSAETLRETLTRSEAVLNDFKGLVDGYAGPRTGLSKYRKRVAWSVWKKQKAEPLRRRLQSYVTTLGMIQNEMNRQEIRDLNGQVMKRTDNISALLRQTKEEVNTQLCSALGGPWDQKPIYFQDAVGRRYPVPLEAVRRFDFAFRGHFIFDFVERRDIWLFTPAINTEKWWYLINELDWNAILRPGIRLNMSIKLRPESLVLPLIILSCSSGSSQFSGNTHLGVDSVRFTKPTPSWADLPEDLEFRWLSKPAPHGTISATPGPLPIDKAMDKVIEDVEDSDKDNESEKFIRACQCVVCACHDCLGADIQHDTSRRDCEMTAEKAGGTGRSLI